MTEFRPFLSDESGASAAEYALILAIIGGAIAVAAFTLGDAVGTSVNNMTECMETMVC